MLSPIRSLKQCNILRSATRSSASSTLHTRPLAQSRQDCKPAPELPNLNSPFTIPSLNRVMSTATLPSENVPPAPSLPNGRDLPASNVNGSSHEEETRRQKLEGGNLASRCAEVYDQVNEFLHRSARPGEDAKRLERAQRQTRASLDTIAKALVEYDLDELSFSYNGGKDCLVLLILYLAGLHAHATRQKFSPPSESKPVDTSKKPRIVLPETLPSIYILSPNPFPSVTSFVTSSSQYYHLSLTSYPTPHMREAFAAHLQANPRLLAIFVGTRRTDPHGASLRPFHPTDGGWPRFMRIHPVLDWHYVDVWTFIRGLGVEYCELYDQGYTSLGGRGDTWPNPKLRIEGSGVDGEEERYRPAYELMEDEEERLGREKKG